MKMSWECSLAVEHLPVVLEALGSVPGAGKTAAATTKIDAPPPKGTDFPVSAAARSEVGMLLSKCRC